ncbi:MAG: hypothetical protein PHC62_08695 [Candidatus Izemoplasmatales bacterium]|nr:hypothetical protein [Candidatus Izemoplasmatales bacterium]
MFLAMLFASIAYNGATCYSQKRKYKTNFKKACDDGMCWCANGKRHYLDGRVEDVVCNKK